MKKIFYFPLFKDWLFYFSIVNLINFFSELLELLSNPQVTDYGVAITQILLRYIIFWGLPLFVRFKLKQRNLKKEIINPGEKLIFVSFSTDDRLIVNKVITELKEKQTSIFGCKNIYMVAVMVQR